MVDHFSQPFQEHPALADPPELSTREAVQPQGQPVVQLFGAARRRSLDWNCCGSWEASVLPARLSVFPPRSGVQRVYYHIDAEERRSRSRARPVLVWAGGRGCLGTSRCISGDAVEVVIIG